MLCGDLGARPDQKLAGALIIPKTFAPRIEILREAKERAFGVGRLARVSSKLGDVIRRSDAKAKKGGPKARPPMRLGIVLNGLASSSVTFVTTSSS